MRDIVKRKNGKRQKNDGCQKNDDIVKKMTRQNFDTRQKIDESVKNLTLASLRGRKKTGEKKIKREENPGGFSKSDTKKSHKFRVTKSPRKPRDFRELPILGSSTMPR